MIPNPTGYKSKDYIIAINGSILRFRDEVRYFCKSNKLALSKNETRAENQITGDRYYFVDTSSEQKTLKGCAGINVANAFFIGEPHNDYCYHFIIGRIRGN